MNVVRDGSFKIVNCGTLRHLLKVDNVQIAWRVPEIVISLTSHFVCGVCGILGHNPTLVIAVFVWNRNGSRGKAVGVSAFRCECINKSGIDICGVTIDLGPNLNRNGATGFLNIN